MARVVYGAYTTVAASLAGLPTDANLTSGRATAEIDASAARALDYHISGFFTVASAHVGTVFEIRAYGLTNASAFNANVSGGGLIDTSGMRDSLQLVDQIPISTTAAHTIYWGPKSIAKTFDGFPPQRFGLAFFQNTGDPLNGSAQSHMVGYRTIEVSGN